MTDLPADPAPAPPELDPGTLASAEFSRARKGFEPAEVRAMLGRGADALRAWKERDDRLIARLADLERRLEQSQELDEQRITTVLGEETARIVTAAREAANEIRSKAEEQSKRLVEETEARATAEADALTGEAASLRDEATAVRDDAVAAAASTRSDAQEHADRVRAEASAEHDSLLAAAKTVLDERTSDAEAVAAGIREAAQIELDAAHADGARLREESRQAAADEVERARSEGRAMVDEARQLRRQMLQDLAERRRTARRQIEAARAGRDRIIEALGTAGDSVAAVIAELDSSDEQVQRAADNAAAAVDDDIDSVVAELETGLTLGGLPLLDDSPSIGLVVADDEDLEVVVDERAPGASGPADPEPADPAPISGGSGSGGSDAADGPGSGDPADLDDPTEPVGVADHEGSSADELSPGATVHDLFERIRAERGSRDDDGSGSLTDGAAALLDDLDGDDLDDDLDDLEDDDLDLTDGALAPVVVLEQPDASAATEDEVVGDDDALGSAGDDVGPDEVDAEAVVEVIDVEVDVVGVVEADGTVDVVGVVETVTAVEVVVATTTALDRRDELLVATEKALARTLKRLVSDEQNEVLDRLRRIRRGRPDLDALLPAGDDLNAFTDALRSEFTAAASAGADFWEAEAGERAGGSGLDQEILDGGLEVRVAELLGLRRAHIQRALDHATDEGIELAELGDHLRAAYREWRSRSVPELAGDLAAAGFALGEQAAAGPGTPWCWEVDHGGLPCSDAEDNALAGAVGCGESFPTGDVVPPAHSGCRCILVPPRR